MQEFLITYDLHKGKEEDYEDLISDLEDAGAVNVQLSVWFLQDEDDEHTCEELRDRFWEHMRKADRLLVVLLIDWASTNNLTEIPQA